ncbi:hypothetical protein [Microbacterium testaceum]|uniref:hypothetical protein n=1 Tax=Microbacterium testaceum TaxID=2033 RepID=UPI0012484196|nr:hypothetical protein [Microbacterium testaceum]
MIDKLENLQSEFSAYLQNLGLVYDRDTQCDMLAAVLSSQLVLFVGPSGTGKSTAAKALSRFFAPVTERATVDVRPGWSASEDLLGQYNSFTDTYLRSPSTEAFVSVRGSASTPFFTIEEANLSPIEAYAGELITAASSTRFPTLTWSFHSASSFEEVPSQVEVGRYPRFLATINVDSTAPAPAPKVSGRACVLLLEPPKLADSLDSVAAISNLDRTFPEGEAAALVGDPHAAWARVEVHGRQAAYREPLRVLLQELADALDSGRNVVSPRDVQRAVIYMSWHVAISGEPAEAVDFTASAENALLHYVLPGLTSEQFGRALPKLRSVCVADGLLSARLDRLESADSGLFGVTPDFWASLS